MRRKAAYNLRTARNLKVNVPQYPELERERMHFEKLYSAAAAAIEETLKQRAHWQEARRRLHAIPITNNSRRCAGLTGQAKSIKRTH